MLTDVQGCNFRPFIAILPLQYLALSKQTPSLRHLNLSRAQMAFGQLVSSSPPVQSGKPSHTYALEMHRPESHIN